MVLISETSGDGSNGGDPNKKPEQLHKNPQEEQDEDNLAPIPRQIPEALIESTVASSLRREPILYALIGFPFVSLPSWYILNRDISRNISLGLSEISSLPPMNPGSAVVTIGHNMYVLGGWIGLNQPVSTVMVIDCRFHTSRFLPNMHKARYHAAAGVIAGRIYVIGGCEKQDNDDWIEVFDVENETWSTVPDSSIVQSSLPGGAFVTSVVIRNKIYILDAMSGLVYEPRQRTWQIWPLGSTLMHFWRKSCCVIDDLLYSFDPRCVLGHPIVVCDPNVDEMVWRPVKGVYGLPQLNYYECKMANFGGKLMVLGTTYNYQFGYKDTWCVEISLERRQGGEIWGSVDSVAPVLISSVNSPYIELCRSISF